MSGHNNPPEQTAGGTTPIDALLVEGIAALGLDIGALQRGSLARFVALLGKWNRVYSLTSVRDPQDMVIRHVLDSLAVIPYLIGSRVLDFGTGPGLPGLVLALARPDWHLTLLDSSAKKLRFVRQAVVEQNIANTEVVETRIEAYRPEQVFDTVITRAFGSLGEIVRLTLPLCADTGVLAAMKGGYPAAELEDLPDTVRVRDVRRLQVPGLHADRHLVIMQKRN